MLAQRLSLGVIPLVILVAATASSPIAQDQPPVAPEETNAPTGRISHVTVYRGQALVSRAIDVPAGRGPSEIVVGELPAYVIPGSLYADGADGVAVRAVRYRTRVTGTDQREEVQAVHEAIEELDQRAMENSALMTLIASQLSYLDKLESFVAPAAMSEMAHGVLNAEQVKQLTDFSFAKREALVKARLELEKTARQLQKDRNLLMLRLQNLGASNSQLMREAVIFVDKQREEATTIALHYLSGGVNWWPTYNLRAESGKDAMKIEYSALVTQASGEDWTSVDLTLSTASPALVAQGAELLPILISLSPNGQSFKGDVDAAQYSKARRELRDNQLKAARSGADMPNNDEQSLERYQEQNEALSRQLNQWACELQKMEFDASLEVLSASERKPEGVSVEYRIAGGTSLQSRNDQQLVSVANLNLEASFAYVATPVLSDYVYIQGEARNRSEIVLLEGTYSAYLDGRFVGRSALPMVSRGQSFSAGFGIDEELRVSRELTNKTPVVRGGNLETTYSYRLLIENYKDREVAVRLFDRMPYSDRSDVRISIKETSEALSTDEVYVRDQKAKGVLRWDTKADAGALDGKAKQVTYSFVVEHDKQMDIVTTSAR